MTKQKVLKKIFKWIIIYCYYIAEGKVSYFPLPGPNHFFHWLPKNFSIGFRIKYLVLSNCSEHVQNVIQWHQNSFFSKNYKKTPSGWELRTQTQAHSQKFAMGGFVWGVWGQSPQLLEANGGLGAKPPAAGGMGVWGQSPSARKFCIFLQK